MCLPLVLKLKERTDSRKDQEIEKRVDDPGPEVEVRQERSAKRKSPPQSKPAIDEPPPEEIDADECDDPHESIREARREFSDAKDPHRERLNPHEQRRLLGERLESNLHAAIIARDEHLASSFGEIDFVP